MPWMKSALLPRPSAIDLAKTQRILPSLTGLRWIAALAVFALHVRNAGLVDGPLQVVLSRAAEAGAVGVSLFFILSGFVLSWADRTRQTAREFWRRRIARIYPLHVVTLVLAILIARTIPVGTIDVDDPVALLANLLLVNTWSVDWLRVGNAVSWTLGCEAFFYLLFPLMIPVARRASVTGLRVALVLLVGLVIALPMIAGSFPEWFDHHTFPLARLPEFAVGVVAARLTRTGSWRGPGVLLSVLLAVGGYGLARIVEFRIDLPACTVVGFTCLMASLALRDVSGRRSPLASRWSVWLGQISFAFSLVHLLVIQLMEATWARIPPASDTHGVLLALAALVASVLLAWALHIGVERPAQRLIAGKPGARRPSAAPAADAR
jgi:peptidoglycan/LPS O-acetylase OafA/YrhL